ncbi:MAG: hypothetical protein IKE49_00535, partial [Firmicutes bacterium]|nr:hypothetical protein [Bacillota bacterium]
MIGIDSFFLYAAARIFNNRKLIENPTENPQLLTINSYIEKMVKTSSIAGPKTFDKNEKGRIYPAQSPVKQQLLTIIPYRRMLTLSATKGPITSGIL